jgi:hypothetical protein
MNAETRKDTVTTEEDTRKPRTPLVFISHDTRDGEIAEAFSKLLSSVSAGVLKSFRSSDRKGNQGIEYGVEWYPEIMKRLADASDVVCLLTPNSINRPWILYEAGVAKGKLETAVHGVALGVPLASASTGPFAQFQNCDDAVDSLTRLVVQLVKRIPNAEPDNSVVQSQVEVFRTRVRELLNSGDSALDVQSEEEAASDAVAKMFEEIKVMYQDLPQRIARRMDPERAEALRRRRSLHPQLMMEAAEFASNESSSPIGILIVLSQFRDDFPWLYDLGAEVYRKLSLKAADASDDVQQFIRFTELIAHHPGFRELGFSAKGRRESIEEGMRFLRYQLERYVR